MWCLTAASALGGMRNIKSATCGSAPRRLVTMKSAFQVRTSRRLECFHLVRPSLRPAKEIMNCLEARKSSGGSVFIPSPSSNQCRALNSKYLRLFHTDPWRQRRHNKKINNSKCRKWLFCKKVSIKRTSASAQLIGSLQPFACILIVSRYKRSASTVCLRSADAHITAPRR